MSITGKLRLCLVVAGLLACAATASAVTLGRVRGAALIGRPVNLTIPVTLEGSESEPCVQADLLQGDSRMPGASARIERGADGNPQVRLTASGVLEEPVLTVYVRLGCAQQVTRRYVLLAEYPDEGAAAPATAAVTPGARASAARTSAPLRAEPQLRRETVARAAPAASAAAASTQAKEPAREPATPRRSRAAKVPAPAAKPHLTLEPFDLSIDTSPSLKGATELRSQPVDGAKRAQAAALWQALNMPPEELVRQNQRIDAMEKEMRGLRGLVQQNTAALNQVGQQLEKARSERNWASSLVAGLVLALLLVGAAAVWGWRRRAAPAASPGRWWQGQATPETVFPEETMHDLVVEPSSKGQPSAPVDLDLSSSTTDPEPPRKKAHQAGVAHRRAAHSDFMHSQPAIMRMVKAEELIDIQQQAEFFFSIGQTDQALSVLEAHVHDHVETSPLAWLDLLEAYHGLGRRDDYERVRSEFHALFNAQVPEFGDYQEASAGLEDYRRALSRIVALWPSPRVLGVIEESIFRKPNTPGAEPFDLQAYRDLLLLYNVAKELARNDPMAPPDSESHPRSVVSEFRSTDLQPLSASNSQLPQVSLPPLSADEIPPASPNLGLDIDLESLDPPEGEAIGEPSSLMSFDFELLPPNAPPSDTSRR